MLLFCSILSTHLICYYSGEHQRCIYTFYWNHKHSFVSINFTMQSKSELVFLSFCCTHRNRLDLIFFWNCTLFFPTLLIGHRTLDLSLLHRRCAEHEWKREKEKITEDHVPREPRLKKQNIIHFYERFKVVRMSNGELCSIAAWSLWNTPEVRRNGDEQRATKKRDEKPSIVRAALDLAAPTQNMRNRSEKEAVNFFALSDTCRRREPFKGMNTHIRPSILMPLCATSNFFFSPFGLVWSCSSRIARCCSLWHWDSWLVWGVFSFLHMSMKYEVFTRRTHMDRTIHFCRRLAQLLAIDRVLIDLSVTTAFGRLFHLITSIEVRVTIHCNRSAAQIDWEIPAHK